MALYNIVCAVTETLGISDVVIGAAVSGYKSFADVPNGAVVSYGIRERESAHSEVEQTEVGTGTWNSATLTLSRTVTDSTNAGSKIVLTTGYAEVYITPLAADFHNPVTLGTASGLSLAAQVLSLGLASAGVTGALSGTDWSTFNAKQAALGYVPVNKAGDTMTGNLQVTAHAAIGVNSNVANVGELLYPGENYYSPFSVEEEYAGTPTGVTFFVKGIVNHLLINPGVSATITQYFGLDTSIFTKNTNAQDINYMVGVYGGVQHDGSGDMGVMRGLEYFAYNGGAGTVAAQQGMFLDVENYGAGKATELIGLNMYLYSEDTDNQYGIYIYTDMGTVVNSYGIYLEDVSGASILNYSIYTNAGKVHHHDVVNTNASYQVDGVKVIGNRVIDARCDDAINSGDATTDGVIDSLRDAMIAHGLIAAA